MDKAKNNLALIKALDVVEAVANGDRYLKDICSRLDIPKSTVHRILLGLIKANYIHEIKDVGLVLGTKLIQLGHIAEDNLPIKQIANPFLRHLAAMTKDTVHLGIRERDSIYFLDSVSGERHVQMSSRQGTCSPLSLSITGKSLMLDMERRSGCASLKHKSHRKPIQSLQKWRNINTMGTVMGMLVTRKYIIASLSQLETTKAIS